MMFSEKEILGYYNSGWQVLDEEARNYIQFHAKRVAFTLGVIDSLINRLQSRGADHIALCDVGPGYLLTEQIQRYFRQIDVNTIGFDDSRYNREKRRSAHFEFDLNNTFYKEWPTFPQHDLVVMCEVLEHLYTAPTQVIKFLKTMIKPGGFLILSTPNSVSFWKRIEILFGRNPYEMIRETRTNPGHFREYTVRELIDVGRKCDLSIEKVILSDYSSYPNTIHHKITKFLIHPFRNFREGITVIYRK